MPGDRGCADRGPLIGRAGARGSSPHTALVPVTVSQVNRLGERLLRPPVSSEDLRLLADFQAEFSPLYEDTRRSLEATARSLLGEHHPPVTGRYKQLRSIVDKLDRETTRLAQLQDIVGLRIVVPDVPAQDELVARLTRDGGPDEWRVNDRRARPRFGYRAVHVIRRAGHRRVEIQVRTPSQHSWAQFVETLDRFAPGLKYGTGPADTQAMLSKMSAMLWAVERPDDPEAAARAAEQADLGAVIGLILMAIITKGKP